MTSSDTGPLSDLELAVAEAGRKVSNYKKPVGPDTRLNGEMGIAGDDGDFLAAEIIMSTRMAIGLDWSDHFGSEPPLGFIIDWWQGLRLKPLTIREAAAGLRNDPDLAATQLASLESFWRQGWVLEPYGSSSTSQ